MPRAKNNVNRKKRVKKMLKMAKGHYGMRHISYRSAKESVMKALSYAYAHRKDKKATFRKLWITRINAGLGENLSYSKFINGLLKSKIILNRKILSNLAIIDKEVFDKIADEAKKAVS